MPPRELDTELCVEQAGSRLGEAACHQLQDPLCTIVCVCLCVRVFWGRGYSGGTSRHTVTADSTARRQTPADESGALSQTAAAVALGSKVMWGGTDTNRSACTSMY